MAIGKADGKHNSESWRGRAQVRIQTITSHGQQESACKEVNQVSNHGFQHRLPIKDINVSV